MGQELDNVLKPLVQQSVNAAGCWRWLGKINKATGYGHKQSNGRTLLAHRWMYTIFHGWIPKDRNLDHLCKNRWCVNPAHLEPVTQAVNCRRGLGTKLTLRQAKEIKALVSAMGWGERRQIAERYGVSAQLLTDIKYGRAWADL